MRKLVTEEVVVNVENEVVHTVKKSRPLSSVAAAPFWASCEAVSSGTRASGVTLPRRGQVSAYRVRSCNEGMESTENGPQLTHEQSLCYAAWWCRDTYHGRAFSDSH